MTFILAILANGWKLALGFFSTPAGKYVLIGLACLALIFGFALHERHSQAAKDAPWITDSATGKKWKTEAEASALDLKTCHSSLTATLASLDAQNAAVEALRVDGDRRAKMLSDGLQAARTGRAGAEARAAALLKNGPVGVDACARSEAARAAVLRSLQP